MERAERDVADGYLLQASNQAWHATKHAINAAAASRNRRPAPVQYIEKRRFIDELVAEPGNGNLKRWLATRGNCTAMPTRAFCLPAT